MKILILTRPDDASPKVLAYSLKGMLSELNIEADISFHIGVLKRLNNFNYAKSKLGGIYLHLKRKLQYFLKDYIFLNSLKQYDAVIISECTPNSFWLNLYAIEKLKMILKPKPVLLYEVYFLGNAPSQINKLVKNSDPTIERYHWHLAVSESTEIYSKPKVPWSCIGLNLKALGYNPVFKEDFTVIVDFEQPGYEQERLLQIKALEQLNIRYISFEKRMPMQQIRKHYKEASVIFIQFPEAFGLPIAECLSYGTAVFTPKSDWLMGWTKFNSDSSRSTELPDCFYLYKDYDSLIKILSNYQHQFDSEKTPKHIFKSFVNHYPHFYQGDKTALEEVILRIKNLNFN